MNDKFTTGTTRKNVDYKDRKGNTALILAAINQNIKNVKDLISAGANVNEQNDARETALFNTSVPIMELLINAGADVNIQDQHGWTALMNVLQKIQDDDDLLNYENHIRVLLDAGADVHELKDTDGRTAYELCENDNCKELLKVLAPLPPDMKRLVASGMNYKDIRNLCLVNKEWNRTVCNNQDFYRALLNRGDVFQHTIKKIEINKMKMFDNIYSCPDATLKILFDFKNEMPFFNPSYRMHEESRNSDVINFAKLPGCNNTVTIDNDEYIWYYFLWAPRNNKYTNYSRKYSDDEIMDDLRNDETFRKYFCGRSVNDIERRTAVNIGRSPFGLSMKRLQILLFNKGIACVRLPLYGVYHQYLSRGAETVKNADGILNLIENENIQVPDGFISLHDVFNVDHPRYRRFYGTTISSLIARVLRPCTLEDLALEYHRGPSFALTVEMQSLSNKKEKRSKYAELLKKYDVIAKIKALMLRLRDGEQTEKIIKIKKGLHKELKMLYNMAIDSRRDATNKTPRKHRQLMFRYSRVLWRKDFGDFIREIIKSKSLLN